MLKNQLIVSQRDCVSGEIDRDLVESIIRKQGYTIIYFRAVNNEDEVDTVLKTLNLESMAMHSERFCLCR